MSIPKPIVEFEQIINRLEYPNSRQEIIEAVRIHGTSNGVTALAETLPDIEFISAAEVMNAIKKN